MIEYLNDTEFAVKSLFELLNTEKDDLEKKKIELQQLESKLEHLRADFLEYSQMDDYNESLLQHKYVQFVKLAENSDIPGLEDQITKLSNSILNKYKSYQAIGMSILQIAKQGISKVHGKLTNCPSGRRIGRESLKNIIWQSRNQAIHHEEGRYHNNVKKCFNNLKIEYGEKFNLDTHPNVNLSIEVLNEVLGWDEYSKYHRDMEALA